MCESCFQGYPLPISVTLSHLGSPMKCKKLNEKEKCRRPPCTRVTASEAGKNVNLNIY